jgi:drug/metabolite transporter (DMT)-like permease
VSEQRRNPLRAAAWMTLAQLLFAAMGVGARIGARAVPWQEVCLTRFLVGAVCAYAIARIRGESLRVVQVRSAWIRSGFGTLAAAGTFFVYAAPRLAVGDAVTLFAISPIFVALLSAPLLGERVRPGVAVAIGLSFSGITLVAQPSFATAGSVVLVGAATALASAFAMIWLRRIGPSESPEAIVMHFSCVGAAVMAVASIPVWQTPDVREALVLAGTGLAGGLGQITMTRAYSLDNAARVSATGYSQIVFARALAFPAFGEIPSALQWLGSGLVIGSGVLLAMGRRLAPRTRERERSR